MADTATDEDAETQPGEPTASLLADLDCLLVDNAAKPSFPIDCIGERPPPQPNEKWREHTPPTLILDAHTSSLECLRAAAPTLVICEEEEIPTFRFHTNADPALGKGLSRTLGVHTEDASEENTASIPDAGRQLRARRRRRRGLQQATDNDSVGLRVSCRKLERSRSSLSVEVIGELGPIRDEVPGSSSNAISSRRPSALADRRTARNISCDGIVAVPYTSAFTRGFGNEDTVELSSCGGSSVGTPPARRSGSKLDPATPPVTRCVSSIAVDDEETQKAFSLSDLPGHSEAFGFGDPVAATVVVEDTQPASIGRLSSDYFHVDDSQVSQQMAKPVSLSRATGFSSVWAGSKESFSQAAEVSVSQRASANGARAPEAPSEDDEFMLHFKRRLLRCHVRSPVVASLNSLGGPIMQSSLGDTCYEIGVRNSPNTDSDPFAVAEGAGNWKSKPKRRKRSPGD